MNHQATKFLVFVALVSLFGLAFSAPARAQVSGATLNGLITDAQGGAVVGAKVSAKNQGTGIAVDTETNEAGAYTIPNLGAADYEVTVTATGFKTAVSKVSLIVGAKQQMNFAMTVGEVAQTVEVTAAAPQVDLTSSTITDEVSAATVRELPLNGRDWASLAQLQPSVVEARTHLDVSHVGGGGGRGFGDQLSIGGGRPTQNSYRLDGVIVNDYSNAGPGSVLGKNLGVDAIQEFTVLTSNYSAEYGFTSGGVINAITKTGTNSFHGTAFDFLRNSVLDANDFFANAGGLGKNPLVQNQFGAAAGYKILKDKLFLFGDYEGVRLATGIPVTGQVTISNTVRQGIVANLTPTPTSTCKATFNCPTTTVTNIDPTIAKYLALYPVPNGTALDQNTGIYNFLGHRAASEDFVTARGDYRISDKDSLFATYLRDNSSFNTPEVYADAQQGFTSYRQAIVAEETHIFSTSFTNTLRGGLDRTENLGGNTPIVNNPAMSNAALGQLPGFFSSAVTLSGTGVTALTGGLNYGASVQDFWGQIRQFYDDAFWSHGNHGFKFGFAAIGYQVDGYTPLAGGNGSGTFTFAGLYNSVSGAQTPTTVQAPCLIAGMDPTQTATSYDASCGSLVNFLTNQPQSAARPIDLTALSKHYLRQKVFAGYFQDDWRIKSNLTLNLGLRYEMSTDPYEKYGNDQVLPTYSTLLPCGGQTVLPLGSCPLGNPTSALRSGFFTQNPTTKNFEPRIGFAWDPFKDGKTSVRGGFGIFDALPLAYELVLNNNSAAPYRPTFVALGPGSGGFESSPGSIAAGTATTAAQEWPYIVPTDENVHQLSPLSRTWQYVQPNPTRNYVYQWNFNISRQITPSLSLLIGYSGSHGLHNPFQADTINTVIPHTDPTTGELYWPVSYDLLSSHHSSTNVAGGGYLGDPNNPCPTISYTSTVSTNTPKNCYLVNTSTGNGIYNTLYQSRSWYNAMQIKLDKRMGHGFQVQVAYTWSKSIDDSSGSTAGDTFSADIVSEPWYNLSLDKGLSDFDVRHNVVINGLWNVPTAPRMGMFGDKVLGGWQLGIITTLASGVPVSASMTAFNNAFDLGGEIVTTNQPPNLVAGCSAQNLVNSNYRTTLSYVNGSCLSLVPATTANAGFCDTSRGAAYAGFCPNIRGDLGRDTIIGPGLFDMDFSVFKNNYIRKISETFNVQFRAEMFNVLNHANFAPTTNLNPFKNINGARDPQFGVLTSTQVPDREIQMALKVIW
jgi:hypothetical protein